jgi:TRAP-type mannitol/chloroaromatic compound transport system permease small subunit
MVSVTRLIPVAEGIEELNERLGRGLAWLVPVMASLQCGLVVAESLFNASSIAVKDAVGYLHALIFLAGAGYALHHDAHVRVDILYRRWSPRARALVDLAGTLCLLVPLFTTILIYSWPYVASSWAQLEGWRASSDGLPLVFLLKTFIPLGAVLLLLQGLALAIRSLATLTGAHPETTPDSEAP